MCIYLYIYILYIYIYVYIYIHMPSKLVMGNILDMDVAENAENGGWTLSH